MSKSWPDVKKMLDDPYVTADTKEMLLASYLRENGLAYGGGFNGPLRTHNMPDDVKSYADKYKLTGVDSFDYMLGTDASYEKAEQESKDKGYHDRQVADQVNQNAGKLHGIQPPAAGGGGCATSDELFDLARPALAVFEQFAPIDAKVPKDAHTLDAPLDFNRDVVGRFDEQRGINFKKFLEEADRLTKAHTSLAGLQSTTESELNSLYKSWTGPAANASYEQYSKQIDPNVKDLLPYLQHGPEVITTAVQTVFKACQAKADQVIKLYRQTIGSATPEIADKVMTLANGQFSKQDDILPVAAWVDSVCGSNLEDRIRNDDCGLNDGNKQYTIDQCRNWIRNSFNVEFWGGDHGDGIARAFKKICDDTVEAVDEAWKTVNDYFKGYENKFAQVSTVNQPPVNTTTPSNTTSSSTGVDTGSSNIPSTSSSQQPPPYVPMPPPGTTGTGGNGLGQTGMPHVPIPGMSTDPSQAGLTDPSGALGGSHLPGTGADPNHPGLPGVPIPGIGGPGSGIGGSGVGGTGLPGSGGAPKDVTINDGKRTITVGEPDARGRSKVTVDNGDGKPKTYEMNFGEAMAGGLTGDDGELVQAGPDGKAVIHDGDTTITGERVPGEPDKMKLTVDDGTPPPTTYTVDFNTESPGAVPPPGGPDPLTGSSGVPGGGGGHAGGGGGGVGGGGGGGGVPGPGGGGHGGGQALDSGAATGVQTPGTADQHAPAAASAGAGAAGGQQQGGPMGGGMGMGGMGGMAGQGGDTTRTSKWRTQGQLFEEDDPAAHFSGIVGEDPANRAARPPKRS